MHALAVEGGRALAKLWGTELLFEDTSRFGAMVPSVRYPCSTPAVPVRYPMGGRQLVTRWAALARTPEGSAAQRTQLRTAHLSMRSCELRRRREVGDAHTQLRPASRMRALTRACEHARM